MTVPIDFVLGPDIRISFIVTSEEELQTRRIRPEISRIYGVIIMGFERETMVGN
jgi:hypothetical protein